LDNDNDKRSESMTNHNEGATDQLEEVSGRWLRDQLREVADGVDDPPEPTELRLGAEASTAQLIDGLASSITAAVVEPIRGLETRREAKQKKLEESLQELSAKLGDAFVEIAKLRDKASAAAAEAERARSEARNEIEAARTQVQSEIDGLRTHSANEIEGLKRHSASEIEGIRQESRSGLESIGHEVRSEVEAVRNQTKEQLESAGNAVRGEIEGVRSGTRRDLDEVSATTSDLRSSFNSLAEEIGRLQEKVREQHERIDALRFRETQRAKAMNELARASSSLREAVTAAAAMSSVSDEEPGSAGLS
jgi:chromosome segregation ATPase